MAWDIPWTVVPIEAWPTEQTRNRQRARFRASWTDTKNLLERELGHLEAKEVLLQMAVTRGDLRLDGKPRANARPEHPGVILTMESMHGPLSYPCDTFDDWQDNVRGVALALQALRAVDRYGVTRRGEQYRGWGQLPPAGGSTSTMTAEAAARVLSQACDGMYPASEILHNRHPDIPQRAYRAAARNTHPDSGGSTEAFQLLQEARRVLEAHHGGPR